jgi:hypothetical protein
MGLPSRAQKQHYSRGLSPEIEAGCASFEDVVLCVEFNEFNRELERGFTTLKIA